MKTTNIFKFIGILGLVLIIAVGVFFKLQNEKGSNKIKNLNFVVSKYGFSFSVPAGWHIWNGQSAIADLITENILTSDFKEEKLTDKKINKFQKFMNNWDSKVSRVIVFTGSKTVDYKNRDFLSAVKIMNIPIDSEKNLKKKAITMYISPTRVDLNSKTINNKEKEVKYIKVGNRKAKIFLVKKYKLVTFFMIQLPISSNKTTINGKVSSLLFTGVIKKGDMSSINKIVSFINSLNISR